VFEQITGKRINPDPTEHRVMQALDDPNEPDQNERCHQIQDEYCVEH
jgi:hypothetical protein